MPTYTPNYNLAKPGTEEFYNISIPNENMEKIDTSLKTIADAVATGATKAEVTQVQTNLTNHEADYVKHPGLAKTNSFAAGVFTVALTPAPTSLRDGMGVLFVPDRDYAGEVSVNLNALGVRQVITSQGLNISSVKSGSIYTLRYSLAKTAFILQGEGGLSNTDLTRLRNDVIAILDM